MRRQSFDVLIAGGGAMGSSAAFWLKRMDPNLRIAVVERDSSYKQASTSLSVGSFRQQFSLKENIQLSMFSSNFLMHRLQTELRVREEDPEPNIGLVQGGYLLLASKAGEANMRENHETQLAMGASVRLYESHDQALDKKFPWINTEGIALGSHGFANEGWFDPYALLMLLRKRATSLGVQYISDSVCGFDFEENSSKISHCRLASAPLDHIACGTVLHTTGAWAAETAKLAGITNFPVKPRKRHVFQFHCPDVPRDGTIFPLTVDPTGMYFRSDGPSQHFLCGASPGEGEEDLDWDARTDPMLAVDLDLFYERLWPLLYHRVPAFARLKLKSSWAGLYEYNVLDQNAIIGPHTRCTNLFFANGFSGHGVQQCIGVGRALAELVVFGEYRTIDLTRLGYSRIEANQPLLERCIV